MAAQSFWRQKPKLLASNNKAGCGWSGKGMSALGGFLLVIRGNPNKHVARELGCTERTVKAHRHRVMEKMQVRTLPELVSLAERIGVASATGQTA